LLKTQQLLFAAGETPYLEVIKAMTTVLAAQHAMAIAENDHQRAQWKLVVMTEKVGAR
jgi:outer membrane protein TolC